jgi:hypothetical protein
MSLKGKTVYVANNKTGKVDKWKCIGEFSRTENGKVRERLCYLMGVHKYVTLPKRCVFDTKKAALAALKK